MSIGSDLIATATEAGIVLRLDGNRLAYDAPDTPEADEVLRLVARLKPDVLRAMEPTSTATNWQRFAALVELERRERRAGR